ncbi:MAG: hypothetical protein GQ564_18765 [Bacteroidales bacterium]|nr:hypothetical protein [Bacteroidales bacterium]
MRSAINNMRTDISKYVIHSLRQPNHSDYPKEEIELEELYFPLRDDSVIYNEFECLINIIEEGGLRASRSFRNGNATIYGGDPVVCFTEMPLINLIQYVKERNDRTRFTEYGIALLKKDVFKNNGRPVISGLSEDNIFKYENKENKIICPKIIPYKEQYRYVNLDIDKGTDWTHEREWRIKCELGKKDFSVRDDSVLNTHLTWGINVFSDFLFSEAIIILKTEDEAKEMQSIVQQQLDCGYSSGGEEFCNIIKYLIIDKAVTYLENNSLTRIEDLPIDTYYEHYYEEISENEKKKIKSIILECTELATKFADEFIANTKIEKDKDGFYKDICGSARVASYETTNKYMRFLLNEGIATSIGDCFWLNKLQDKVPFVQCMSYYAYIANKQCDFLNKEIEAIFTVYSMRD